MAIAREPPLGWRVRNIRCRRFSACHLLRRFKFRTNQLTGRPQLNALGTSIPSTHLIKLVDYTPPPFRVPTVDLSIELGRTETIVRNTMRVVRDKGQEKQPLRLNG